jgi:hypothetical protein
MGYVPIFTVAAPPAAWSILKSKLFSSVAFRIISRARRRRMKRWWNLNHTTARVLLVLAGLLLARVASQVAPPKMLLGRR